MKLIKNLFYIFFPLIIGITVSLLTRGNFNLNELKQPPLAPPSILFPIVWTILYLLIGISYYLYKKNTYTNKTEIIIYYTQLLVNALWSIIFFTLKLRFFSIIWILALIILIYTLITLFNQKYKPSAYLLIPYLIWCIFATYLNIGIYLLN
ncbi:MAG: TspO/MBR family protein [Bacilli bacterium]